MEKARSSEGDTETKRAVFSIDLTGLPGRTVERVQRVLRKLPGVDMTPMPEAERAPLDTTDELVAYAKKHNPEYQEPLTE